MLPLEFVTLRPSSSTFGDVSINQESVETVNDKPNFNAEIGFRSPYDDQDNDEYPDYARKNATDKRHKVGLNQENFESSKVFIVYRLIKHLCSQLISSRVPSWCCQICKT